MPIANCFIKDKELTPAPGGLNFLVKEWAQIIGVDAQDISINIVTGFIQLGQRYSVMVNIYLPSMWSEGDVEKIQLGLMKVLAKNLNIPPDRIFIITSIVASGHVVENGKIIRW